MTIVDCAVYKDGERRDGQARPAGGVRALRATTTRRGSGSACTSRPRRSSTRSARSSTSTRWPSRTRSRRTSGPKLEEYGDSLFLVLKPARYHDETEEVEFGEILIFMGEGFLITVRHGDTTELHDVRMRVGARPREDEARPGRRAARDHGPDRRRLRPGARRASRTTSRRSSRRSSRPTARTRRSGSTTSSARCWSCTARPRRCSGRSTGWRTTTTPYIPEEMHDVLPRRATTTRSASTSRSRTSARC